jgi:hypothetical protein
VSIDNIVTCISIARQRLGKHKLKARIAAEAEVNLLGNGTQTPVSAATNINKGIPVTTNRITESRGHGDFYSGRLAFINGVHSCIRVSGGIVSVSVCV